MQDRTGVQTSLLPLKSSIAECLHVVKDVPIILEQLGLGLFMRKLEDMAKELGLVFPQTDIYDWGDKNSNLVLMKSCITKNRLHYVPMEDNENTSVICGAIVVVDIVVDPDKPISVKLSYAGHDPSERHDFESNLLTDLLRRGNFHAFKENLASLAFLDKHSGFHHMNCLAEDLRAIHQIELTNSKNDHESVMLEGHGLPHPRPERLGPSLIYWATPLARLNINWAEQPISNLPSEGVCTAFVAMEHYSNRPYLPPSKTGFLLPNGQTDLMIPDNEEGQYVISQGFSWHNEPLSFLVPTPTSSITAPATYYLHLCPPIASTAAIGKQIAIMVGIANNDGLQSSPVIDAVVPTRYGTLEELLARDVLVSEELSGALPHLQFKAVFDDEEHFYEFKATHRPDAIVIKKIPFSHTAQIFPVLKLLRRHLVFNALFRSCFNANTYHIAEEDDGVPSTPARQFVLHSWTPPQVLEFRFIHSRPPYRYQVLMVIDEHAKVNVRCMQLSQGTFVPVSGMEGGYAGIDAAANKVLDVPIVMRKLCKFLSSIPM
ncbi:hypothetical protein HK104_011429 [Borealophlyctis nickersoniae]|nr:hypothetical protein HK104_011429 [Borealophlyctis nickersoniae]